METTDTSEASVVCLLMILLGIWTQIIHTVRRCYLTFQQKITLLLDYQYRSQCQQNQLN